MRTTAWLAFIVLLFSLSSPLDAEDILGCTTFVVAVASHAWMYEARSGIRELMSLKNAIWLGLLIYALPIYILSATTDITLLLAMSPESLSGAARISFVSIAVTGVAVEFLRSWGMSLHRHALRQIASESSDRQYYAAAILVVIYGGNYLSTGVLNLVSSGDRFAITQAFETGKMWFIQYLMTGVTIAFIYQNFQRSTLRGANYYIGLISVFLFWALYVSLGNRRGILTVVFAASVCFVARSSNGKRVAVWLLLIFLIGGAIGVLRQNIADASPDQFFLLGVSNFFGEFIYPGFTLVHTVELDMPASFDFTWVTMLYDFISAQLQGVPFGFLAHRFAVEVAPSGADIMGFAYLPITEAYLNFGVIAASASGVALLVTVLLLAWICKNRAWVYLILLSLALDMNRSEFAAMVFQFLIVIGGFLLTTKIGFEKWCASQ
ncbi:MAG: hypothetical protein KGM99_12520 [Burkholderiales bacterium]|nr:hypothetical protein [Burkholderiales bacterium]